VVSQNENHKRPNREPEEAWSFILFRNIERSATSSLRGIVDPIGYPIIHTRIVFSSLFLSDCTEKLDLSEHEPTLVPILVGKKETGVGLTWERSL